MSQLDQEEALALVLAHLRGYALLPDEARNIGELARLAAIAYKGKPPGAKGKAPKKKPADQVLKDNASTAKSQARAAAAKDATLAAGLMERLEGIDAVAATNRRQLARAPVTLPWPARNSVIATRAPPKPQDPGSKLRKLRQKLALTQAEATAAEADTVATRRVAERLRQIASQMESSVHEEALHGDTEDSEQFEALLAQCKIAQDVAQEARREHDASLRLLRDLCDAVGDASQAVRDEEEAQGVARAAQAAAAVPAPAPAPAPAQSGIAEQLAALRLEHEQALAQVAQREAQLQAVRARAPPPREGAVAKGLSLTLTVADPAAVGRVFKLTGLSAAEVNGMAASVSQAKTGALWDDNSAWNRYDDAVRKPRDP